ncbi:hypothetical protein [Thiocapsa bogorovii]|uniref:hypothetical protein n=1 Tax=Thiocapsa bogorovii TaxID=521689 RepID=UPI001E3EAB00|nr:hypothetical protein [Thiocapsa bogorovii]UHD15893.1 hypothetical protein LT988_21985 [Thiocapsa bogorovii]
MIDMSGMRLAVYWSDVPGVGTGPSASLYVLEEEILRLDCFGGQDGHLHVNPEQYDLYTRFSGHTPRIYFPPGSRQEHVERAAFELRRNAVAAARMSPIERIRACPLAEEDLASAAESMRRIMSRMLTEHLPEAGQAIARDGRNHATANISCTLQNSP